MPLEKYPHRRLVKLTDRDIAAVERDARKRGTTLSQWIREAIRDRIARVSGGAGPGRSPESSSPAGR